MALTPLHDSKESDQSEIDWGLVNQKTGQLGQDIA